MQNRLIAIEDIEIHKRNNLLEKLDIKHPKTHTKCLRCFRWLNGNIFNDSVRVLIKNM